MIFVVTCEALQDPENGYIFTYIGTRVGSGEYATDTTAFFRCDHGYNLNGSEASNCVVPGIWDEPVPTCEQGN